MRITDYRKRMELAACVVLIHQALDADGDVPDEPELTDHEIEMLRRALYDAKRILTTGL